MKSTKEYRAFLKADLWEEWKHDETDQKKQVPPPPVQQPYPADAQLIDLVGAAELTVGQLPVIDAITQRRSRRQYTEEPLTLEELSFLLWATQGVSRTQGRSGEVIRRGPAVLRTAPSGGARHPFETYLLVRRVEGVASGLYRYLPLDHKLCFVGAGEELATRVRDAWEGQGALMTAAAVFIWTVLPYRTEWRYSFVSHKIIAQDSGHLCQNLYLAAESIGAGTCAFGAYDQRKTDAIVGVGGQEEFVIYLAPVGKVG